MLTPASIAYGSRSKEKDQDNRPQSPQKHNARSYVTAKVSLTTQGNGTHHTSGFTLIELR
jgi:hypothetical protein